MDKPGSEPKSIHLLSVTAYPMWVAGGLEAGGYPRCHRARGGVASPSQGHRETQTDRQTSIHTWELT
ncbi:hypothetical protein EXN66_Car012028 [Channa argus]|uniref:Uncharacterized protein n=1 Tax=Channa argus TaxID=215402 RepID=A0A6G1Q171_CHAAH|nr:hypothetical protein EXN66_Car012028 [Channa argus]